MKPSYEFISYPYGCEYGSSVNKEIRHVIMDRDVMLDDMLDEFLNYLRACGYPINYDSRLELIDNRKETNICQKSSCTLKSTDPKLVSDTILPVSLKQTFQQFVDQKNVPNLLLTGTAGVGKTTIAKAMLEELGCDYIVINGSDEGRLIDTLRTKIKGFASSMSLSGGRKYVILDEADYLNAETVQPALRNFMEEYSANCGFIMTCNFANKIIEPLRSRCSVVEFKMAPEDKPKLAGEFFKRVCNILTGEGVEFDKPTVVEVVKKHFPDNRRVLNELQRYAATGKIDAGILVNFSELGNERTHEFDEGERVYQGS